MSDCVCMESMRERLGLHPWHFWGWADSTGIGQTAAVIPVEGCDDVVYEYPFQGRGRVSRDELRKAISEASDKLQTYLGYSPRRTFQRERVWLSPPDPKGCRRFTLCSGHVTKIGCERIDLLGSASIVYIDGDGDGLKERAQILKMGALPAGTTADELVVAFDAGDVPNTPDDIDRWRVCPVEVQINPANVLFTAPAWVMARPLLREGFSVAAKSPLDPTIATNFVSIVRVYRRWIDTACTFTSGKRACGHAAPCSCECVEQVCGGTNDVAPQVENCRAGIGVVRGLDADWIDIGYEVDPSACGCDCDMCDALTALAVSLLKPPCCACQKSGDGWTMHRWQDDRALRTQELAYLGATVESTPFGTRGGAIEAWQKVKMCRRAKGLRL